MKTCKIVDPVEQISLNLLLHSLSMLLLFLLYVVSLLCLQLVIFSFFFWFCFALYGYLCYILHLWPSIFYSCVTFCYLLQYPAFALGVKALCCFTYLITLWGAMIYYYRSRSKKHCSYNPSNRHADAEHSYKQEHKTAERWVKARCSGLMICENTVQISGCPEMQPGHISALILASTLNSFNI